jgi:dTMP kinase
VGETPAVEQVHGPGGVRGVLRITIFRRLYVALALSSMGDWLGFLATTGLAVQLVQSFEAQAYATGGVLVFRLLPAVLFGPLAGAFADRWDRRRTMVVCDLLRFALFLSIPLVGAWYGRGTEALVWLLAASFLIETVSLFWIPAKEASVPNIVPRERLEAANQLTLVATYGSAVVAAGVFALLSLVSRALGSGVSYFATGRSTSRCTSTPRRSCSPPSPSTGSPTCRAPARTSGRPSAPPVSRRPASSPACARACGSWGGRRSRAAC